MNATVGLAASQFRALGITVGALYGFFAVRGVVTRLSLRTDVMWEPTLVSALAWVPGVVALFAFIANRIDPARRALAVAAITYPVAVLLWPVVAVRDAGARVDFWIHGMPGLAAIAAILTLPRMAAWGLLLFNCVLVEIVMRAVGIVDDWNASLVRLAYSLAYSGFFFLLVISVFRDINRGNRVLLRSGRDQAEAAMMRARDEEIERLDRLTHDFVLSLLSSAAEGVPADKLRVQAETVRRQLGTMAPDEDEADTIEDMVGRIKRRCVGYSVPVHAGDARAEAYIPRQKAVEIEAAVEEAVRNSVRHATGGSRVIIGDHGVTIEIRDDGPGFDPARVQERLGVSQSILHRVNSLIGGHAEIDSAPGRGTIVTIRWSPP